MTLVSGAAGLLPSVVFLDRDGTIIEDRHYLHSPDGVVLLPGAARAIARLNHAEVPVVLITNQSGLGRGYFTVEQYEAVHARMIELLALDGAKLDASYYCADSPEVKNSCRKPSARLFRKAIREHDLDMSRAIYIGDRWRDLAPMLELGGKGILVESGHTSFEDFTFAQKHARVVESLEDAVEQIFEESISR